MISSDWRSQIFEKKIGGPNLDPAGLNQAQNEVFVIFLSLDHKFSFKLHTIIAWDNI